MIYFAHQPPVKGSDYNGNPYQFYGTVDGLNYGIKRTLKCYEAVSQGHKPDH